jgi:hypothetical protein
MSASGETSVKVKGSATVLVPAAAARITMKSDVRAAFSIRGSPSTSVEWEFFLIMSDSTLGASGGDDRPHHPLSKAVAL